jgi:myo-inositol-1(or 4)-monophosphatase
MSKFSAAFHGLLSLDKQKKIPQILKLMQFPSSDAYSLLTSCRGQS